VRNFADFRFDIIAVNFVPFFSGSRCMMHINAAILYDQCVYIYACEGSYGVPEGMMFYMPVRHVSPGQYLVVDDLPLNLAARKKIRAIVKVRIIRHYNVYTG